MFFLIGGVQPRSVILDERAGICPACGYPAVQTKRIDHYLSLFFIPLVRVKKGVPFSVCSRCRAIREPGNGADRHTQEGPPRTCRSCGKTTAAIYVYCPYCGVRL